jgi:succinate dehydrogenase/fumarate reductase flavoprotein subunit
MKKYTFDAIVIGSGCAGYNCADTLFDLGVKNIAIVTEGRTLGTSRNTGSDKQTYYKLSLAGDEGDSVFKMASTLFDGGAMDGDVAVAEAANSVRSFMKLVQLGVDFPTNDYGEYVAYKTDHDPCSRATSIGPYTSKKMTEVLESSVMSKGITILDKLLVVKILCEDGHVVGVLAYDKKDGESVAIRADQVVLASGGPASVYFDSVYPVGHTGASSLAINAGAEMRNLAEWQYGLASIDFRWNVSGTYQQVLPRYISIDENGVEREFLTESLSAQDAIERVFLKGYEWPFDSSKIERSSKIDLLVYHESVILGRKVYMDFTREPSGAEDLDSLPPVAKDYLSKSDALIPLPIERLKKMNPGAISLYRDHGIDITKEPLRIAVCAQHNNGGVSVDLNWQSTVKGLFVVGEAAGTLGIFRPGGSALNSCQVGGLQAARYIAYESEPRVCDSFDSIAAEAEKELMALFDATGSDESTVKAMQKQYEMRMSRYFAFDRRIPDMEDVLEEIKKDLASFTEHNKWTKPHEKVILLKNLDIIYCQEIIAASMLYTAKRFGSRGSALVRDAENNIIPELMEGRKKIVTLKRDGEITINEREVRPIPDRNLWFEKVWGEFRRKTEK